MKNRQLSPEVDHGVTDADIRALAALGGITALNAIGMEAGRAVLHGLAKKQSADAAASSAENAHE